MNGNIEDLEARTKAVELTVQYFLNKQVTEDVFMTHLEKVYKFLLTGKI